MFTRNSLVGLDIGCHEIKAIELVEAADGPQVNALATMPAVDPLELPQAIRSLFADAGIKTRNVAVSLSGQSVIVRYIAMPEMSAEDLRSSMKYEAGKHIPFELDEVALDCARLDSKETSGGSEEADEMQVLLVAAKKEVLNELLGLIRAAALVPVAVDVDGFALGSAFELYASSGAAGAGLAGVKALVYVGASKSSVNILEDGSSSFSREIYLAGKDFTDAVSRRMGVEQQEGDRIKRDSAGEDDEVRVCLSPVGGDLVAEVHASVDYFENHHDRVVDSVWISGGSAHLPGLSDSFEQTFCREVKEWNPLEGIAMADGVKHPGLENINTSGLAVEVGLASRVLDD